MRLTTNDFVNHFIGLGVIKLKTKAYVMNIYVFYQSKCKNPHKKNPQRGQNPFLSCLSEEEHWCKKLVRSYKPHTLHYLTSTRLLFTQNGPWLKQKLEGSVETMGREDENNEEGKENKINYRRWWRRRKKTEKSFILRIYFSKKSLVASFVSLLTFSNL